MDLDIGRFSIIYFIYLSGNNAWILIEKNQVYLGLLLSMSKYRGGLALVKVCSLVSSSCEHIIMYLSVC